MDTNNDNYLNRNDPDSVDVVQSLKDLAQARLNLEWAKQAMDAWIQAAKDNDAYKTFEVALNVAKDEIKKLTDDIKGIAMAGYTACGTKEIADGVKIVNGTIIEYDEQAAIEWCAQSLLSALKLDENFFEKHARAVAGTAPIPFVKISDNPKVTIATDLSGYLGDQKQ